MHRDLFTWRLQGRKRHRMSTSHALMPYMPHSGQRCRLRAGRQTSKAHVDHLVEDHPPERLLVEHKVQGEQQHEESVADVPKHHRKQEWEGHDGEDLQAAQNVSAACSGAVYVVSQANLESCYRSVGL